MEMKHFYTPRCEHLQQLEAESVAQLGGIRDCARRYHGFAKQEDVKMGAGMFRDFSALL